MVRRIYLSLLVNVIIVTINAIFLLQLLMHIICMSECLNLRAQKYFLKCAIVMPWW